jgi:cytochrome c biogenesis protein CcdA
MALFFEGAEAIRQPCTLPILLASVVFVAAAGRQAPIAAIAFVTGVAVMAWLRFASLLSVDLDGFNAIAAGALIAVAAVTVALTPADRSRSTFVAAASAMAGAVTAALWRPCVGLELASVLDTAPGAPLDAFLPLSAYVLGVSLLTLAFGFVAVAWPELGRPLASTVVTRSAAAIGVVLGTTIAIGWWSELVDELLRRSSA